MLNLTRLEFAGYRNFPSDLGGGRRLNQFDLKPLTLVFGKNGSGKSQALRLFHQVIAGICGETNEVLPAVDRERRFCMAPEENFYLKSPVHPVTVRMEWRFHGEPGEMEWMAARSDPSQANSGIELLFFRLGQGAHQVQADSGFPPWKLEPWASIRAALRDLWAPSTGLEGLRDRLLRVYPSPGAERGRLGLRGDGVASWLYHSDGIRNQVRDWLVKQRQLSSFDTELQQGELRLIERRNGVILNLSEAAEGLHQVLPVATLWKTRAAEHTATLDTVEQPELHLHDAFHADLGDLALAAVQLGDGFENKDKGQRLIVETHSEGLLLRVRRRIAEGSVNAAHVALHYAERDERGSRLRPIPLTADGDPEFWPEGIFLERLSEARAISVAHRRRNRAV